MKKLLKKYSNLDNKRVDPAVWLFKEFKKNGSLSHFDLVRYGTLQIVYSITDDITSITFESNYNSTYMRWDYEITIKIGNRVVDNLSEKDMESIYNMFYKVIDRNIKIIGKEEQTLNSFKKLVGFLE